MGVLTFYRGAGERRGGVAGEFNVGVRWGYGGKSVDNPISIWVRFGWCMLTTTPACLWKMSPSEGRASCSESGEVESLPILLLHPLLCRPPLRIQAQKGCPPLVPSPPSGRHSGPIFSVSMPHNRSL
jgi:hypothetical protein